MDEKTDMAPAYDHGPHKAVDVKNAAYGEAADLYGDAEAAERYGYVARGYAIIESLQKGAGPMLTDRRQAEVPTHPVHRSRWNYRYWSLPGYRTSAHPGRSALAAARLYLCRSRDLRHGKPA